MQNAPSALNTHPSSPTENIGLYQKAKEHFQKWHATLSPTALELFLEEIKNIHDQQHIAYEAILKSVEIKRFNTKPSIYQRKVMNYQNSTYQDFLPLLIALLKGESIGTPSHKSPLAEQVLTPVHHALTTQDFEQTASLLFNLDSVLFEQVRSQIRSLLEPFSKPLSDYAASVRGEEDSCIAGQYLEASTEIQAIHKHVSTTIPKFKLNQKWFTELSKLVNDLRPSQGEAPFDPHKNFSLKAKQTIVDARQVLKETEQLATLKQAFSHLARFITQLVEGKCPPNATDWLQAIGTLLGNASLQASLQTSFDQLSVHDSVLDDQLSFFTELRSLPETDLSTPNRTTSFDGGNLSPIAGTPLRPRKLFAEDTGSAYIVPSSPGPLHYAHITSLTDHPLTWYLLCSIENYLKGCSGYVSEKSVQAIQQFLNNCQEDSREICTPASQISQIVLNQFLEKVYEIYHKDQAKQSALQNFQLDTREVFQNLGHATHINKFNILPVAKHITDVINTYLKTHNLPIDSDNGAILRDQARTQLEQWELLSNQDNLRAAYTDLTEYQRNYPEGSPEYSPVVIAFAKNYLASSIAPEAEQGELNIQPVNTSAVASPQEATFFTKLFTCWSPSNEAENTPRRVDASASHALETPQGPLSSPMSRF